MRKKLVNSDKDSLSSRVLTGDRIRAGTAIAMQLEKRLREMADAYLSCIIIEIDFGLRQAVLKGIHDGPNSSIERMKRTFSVKGNSVRFLDETSNLSKTFTKTEHPITHYEINGQRVFSTQKGKIL